MNTTTSRHPLAGTPAPKELLCDVPALLAAFHDRRPDPGVPAERVAFGTSGHRGSPLRGSFQQDHVLAVAQAIAEHRDAAGLDGPLFLGRDTHALSLPAADLVAEVLAANGVTVVVQSGGQPAPTPVVSWRILVENEGTDAASDGVVVTPSHNPPEDGGLKYNPPEGGPADSATTSAIERRANEILEGGLRDVRRASLDHARRGGLLREEDWRLDYVRDLDAVLDMEAIARARLRLGADPLGGAALGMWDLVNEVWGTSIETTCRAVDPTFSFLRVDHDGRLRMDCSSAAAMAGLVELAERFDLAFGNDPDADRHGIVVPGIGLLAPNLVLAASIDYLLSTRRGWSPEAGVGKTVVSSALIDRVVEHAGRSLVEVPVGFKFLAPGLLDGDLCFGGEESAGASFLRLDGTTWTTDKDGIVVNLLAAECLATTGEDLGRRVAGLEERFGRSFYRRVDLPADPSLRRRIASLEPSSLGISSLAGDPIESAITKAPGHGAPIGGIKVSTRSGWFAARPSGTEDIVKIYAESMLGEDHLERILEQAREVLR